jgi:hypothetical protein
MPSAARAPPTGTPSRPHRATSCGPRTARGPATTTTAGKRTSTCSRGEPRRLPLLDLLGAGPARGKGHPQRRGPRLLRPPRGRPARARAQARRHALPLGASLAPRRSRRLAQPRHRGLVRRLHRGHHAPHRRPRLVGRADQRALVRGLAVSHFLGHHAPGLRDIRATARAMHHVLLAHGTAIGAMRALGMTNLGAVCNFEYASRPTTRPRPPPPRISTTATTTASSWAASSARSIPPTCSRGLARTCPRAGRTTST